MSNPASPIYKALFGDPQALTPGQQAILDAIPLAAPSHPPATPAVAVQAEPPAYLNATGRDIWRIGFNTALSLAHPKPAAPATADEAVSDEVIDAVIEQHWGVKMAGEALEWRREFARAILALRSGASAQHAGGATPRFGSGVGITE